MTAIGTWMALASHIFSALNHVISISSSNMSQPLRWNLSWISQTSPEKNNCSWKSFHTHTTTEFNGMLWIVCGIEVHFDSQPTRLEPEEKVYRDVLRRYTDTDAIDQSDLRHFLEGVGFKPRSKPERDLLTPSTHKGLLMFVGWWGENAACSVWFWGMGVVMIGMRDEVCRASWLFCW